MKVSTAQAEVISFHLLFPSNTYIIRFLIVHSNQTVLEKEHIDQLQEHKHNESNLLKENRIDDKHTVRLQSRLDVINVSVDLLRIEHSYHIVSAVNEAKRDERRHYSGLLQSHKESIKEVIQFHKDVLQCHEAVFLSHKTRLGSV